MGANSEPLVLKPCPFCGGTNILVRSYYVRCGNCGGENPCQYRNGRSDDDFQAACAVAWNRRTPDPTAERLAAACRELLVNVSGVSNEGIGPVCYATPSRVLNLQQAIAEYESARREPTSEDTADAN